jgi:hypothetical protein
MQAKMAIVSVMDYTRILLNSVVQNLGVATHQWVATTVSSLPFNSFFFLKRPPPGFIPVKLYLLGESFEFSTLLRSKRAIAPTNLSLGASAW